MKPKNINSSICIIVKLTNNCDLTCSYCGVAGPKSSTTNSPQKVMKEKQIYKLYTILSRSQQITDIDFIWHGGEPLLINLKLLDNIINAQNIFVGKTITNSIQTNGTLITDAVAKFIKEHKIRVGISLDGPKEIHDAQRPMRVGSQSSFDLTMKGIEVLKKYNIPFGALAVATKKTLEFGAKNLFNFFIQNDITTFDFLPQEPIIFDNKVLTDYIYPKEEYTSFLIDLFNVWYTYDDPKVSIIYYEALIKSFLNKNSEICQIGKDTCINIVFTFYPDNTLTLCDKFPRSNEDKNNMNINIDSIESIDKVFLNKEYKKVLTYQGRSNKHCTKCEWFSYCRGGCIYDRYMYRTLKLPFNYAMCPLNALYNHVSNIIIDKK